MTRVYTFTVDRRPGIALIVRIPQGEEQATIHLRRCNGTTHSTLLLGRFESAGRAGAVAAFLLMMAAELNRPTAPLAPTHRSIYGGPNGHHCWN